MAPLLVRELEAAQRAVAALDTGWRHHCLARYAHSSFFSGLESTHQERNTTLAVTSRASSSSSHSTERMHDDNQIHPDSCGSLCTDARGRLRTPWCSSAAERLRAVREDLACHLVEQAQRCTTCKPSSETVAHPRRSFAWCGHQPGRGQLVVQRPAELLQWRCPELPLPQTRHRVLAWAPPTHGGPHHAALYYLVRPRPGAAARRPLPPASTVPGEIHITRSALRATPPATVTWCCASPPVPGVAERPARHHQLRRRQRRSASADPGVRGTGLSGGCVERAQLEVVRVGAVAAGTAQAFRARPVFWRPGHGRAWGRVITVTNLNANGPGLVAGCPERNRPPHHRFCRERPDRRPCAPDAWRCVPLPGTSSPGGITIRQLHTTEEPYPGRRLPRRQPQGRQLILRHVHPA